MLATIVNIFVAAMQWHELKENDVAQTRPWVAPFNASIMHDSQNTWVHLSYNNFGKDFASNFTRTISYTILPWHDDTKAEEDRIASPAANQCFGRAVNSTGTLVFAKPKDMMDGGSEANKDISREDQSAVIDPAKMTLVTGCMTYTAGSSTHHTSFCFYFHQGESSNAALGYCNFGNYAD